MNVMLISVTQRTNEIGLRKAAGAQKRDIFNQFLTESILVSLFGTLIGIITGILISLAVNPIVFMITEIRFTPVFSASSILFITLVSMFIGILFGTFPAYKASRLDPILAIQRE
jgi:putative ABC transport system permease protein